MKLYALGVDVVSVVKLLGGPKYGQVSIDLANIRRLDMYAFMGFNHFKVLFEIFMRSRIEISFPLSIF